MLTDIDLGYEWLCTGADKLTCFVVSVSGLDSITSQPSILPALSSLKDPLIYPQSAVVPLNCQLLSALRKWQAGPYFKPCWGWSCQFGLDGLLWRMTASLRLFHSSRVKVRKKDCEGWGWGVVRGTGLLQPSSHLKVKFHSDTDDLLVSSFC